MERTEDSSGATGLSKEEKMKENCWRHFWLAARSYEKSCKVGKILSTVSVTLPYNCQLKDTYMTEKKLVD